MKLLNRENFRNDIQSLRALAVGLVIAAHAGLSWLPGGFVGVDVFFVLSGYLISGIILREIQTFGQFDPWLFYAQRLKRLLPALSATLVVSCLVAWFSSSPQQQIADAAAGQAAALWLSNIYFATRTINYFDHGASNNLFLHTWSLSVEEQFYLIWPSILLFLYGAWRWQGRSFNHFRLWLGLSLLAGFSLLLSIYLSKHQVEDGFYLMPSRAWEFSLGTLIYLAREACKKGRVSWLARLQGQSVLNVSGFLFILFSAAVYTNELRYPGYWALLPCLGCAFVLLDDPVQHPQTFVSRLVLHEQILQFIGNISYSLYLWHWPVFVLGISIFGGSSVARFFMVLLCFAVATVAYYGIELPIHSRPIKNKAAALIIAIGAISSLFFVMTFWSTTATNLLNGPEQSEVRIARFDLPEIYNNGCDTWYHSAAVSPCVIGSPTSSHTVVMFGDSVLAQWYPAIAQIFLKNQDWRLVVLTKSACPNPAVSYYYDRIKSRFEVCDLWREHSIDHIRNLQPDVLIMGSRDYGFSSEQVIAGMQAILDRLSPVSKSIFVINPTPDLGFDGPGCLSQAFAAPRWLQHRHRCETILDATRKPLALGALQESAKSYSNVNVLDLDDLVCPDNVCRARNENVIIFRDTQHLTSSFVRSLTPILEKKFGVSESHQ